MKQSSTRKGFRSQFKHSVTPQNGYKNALEEARKTMSDLSVAVREKSLPFDSRLSKASIDDCITSLISSRIYNKFHVKSRDLPDLTSAAIMDFTKYDRGLKLRMSRFSMTCSPEVFTVRRRLLKMLKNYFLNFNEDIDVGPGETYITSHGHTSLISKLSDIDHWTTTPNCLYDTHRLIYENRGLKAAARKHIGVISRKETAFLWSLYGKHPDPGYAIFCHHLDKKVLKIVTGSRGTTVPKNNEKERFINIEALFPMILQRYVASAIKRCLTSEGYGLERNEKVPGSVDRQVIHRRLIRFSRYATIDFSSASDSVSMEVVENLFPKRVVNDLTRYRSSCVGIPTDFTLNKLSSMGNGFTFETMTTLLLAACRVFTDDCSVFGDDVILPNAHAADFVKLARQLGFHTNNKKTFINSHFRESCGGFYCDGHGYLVSFDFNSIETYSDIIIAHNKLKTILDHQDLPKELSHLLNQARRSLLGLAPALRRGPVPKSLTDKVSNLSLYFFDEQYLRKHKQKPVINTYRLSAIEKLGAEFFTDYQWESSDFSIVAVSSFLSKRVSRERTRHRTVVELVRLKTLRPTNEVIRGKGSWREHLALVCNHTGRLFRLNTLRVIRKEKTRDVKTSGG